MDAVVNRYATASVTMKAAYHGTGIKLALSILSSSILHANLVYVNR